MPGEYQDAARVDGCDRLQAFWHVMLPTALQRWFVRGLMEGLKL